MRRRPRILSVLGTRPEIVKFSPILPLLDRAFRHRLVHTGQHYDENMDRVFFRELRLRTPDDFLKVGSGGQGAQTARMLERLEPILTRFAPEWVMVLGDTNSTLAGALVAAKRGIRIAHIEAGCRSFNRAMPEEINRVLVDHVSDLLFAPDAEAVRHLREEGIRAPKVHLVGNTGLDAVRRTMRLAGKERLRRFGVRSGGFALATIHRAENTDDPARCLRLMEALKRISTRLPVLFPVHPRTRGVLKRHGIRLAKRIRALDPLGNLDFVALMREAMFVLSDSGGIQEEAAVVNTPCLILREETEWTRLVKAGKNFLVGTHPAAICLAAERLMDSSAFRARVATRVAPLNFGASRRILRILRAQAISRSSKA
ncbi:MAG: UDP-N-acetylglucosamine 2-epimerase (non-hydrolyzing) [Verrucomicrobiae bacterium]|nr:UDP-N-acetylglucosamine 2-epimerase (non-hydrolyzing) [Verrucomicrobiae bacterium]